MEQIENGKLVTFKELMVSTLAMTDALAKLLIEKGLITDAEFKQKLLEERAVYQRILNPTAQYYLADAASEPTSLYDRPRQSDGATSLN